MQHGTPAGIPIRSTLDNATTVQYAGHVQQLNAKARTTVRDLDPTNDLTFLRVRTNKHEIMVAPGEWRLVAVGTQFPALSMHAWQDVPAALS